MANTYGQLVSDDKLSQGLSQVKPRVPAAWLTAFVPAIEAALETFCHRKLIYKSGIVEWPEVSDDTFFMLDQTPVDSVAEIRLDTRGGFGQIADTFGDDTVLTPGVDYYIKIDGKGDFAGKSATGIVYRNGRAWGYSRSWQRGLLASQREPVQGTIKVTYSGGYTSDNCPDDLQTGLVRAISIIYQTMPFVGPVGSEMIGGYNYSKSIGADLTKHAFESVRDFIEPYRRRRVGGGGRVS